jgi:hypothetical protein
MKKREAITSLKDHKENFENNPKCRLINPAKSESGKLSKVILDKINSNFRQTTQPAKRRRRRKRVENANGIEVEKLTSFQRLEIDVVSTTRNQRRFNV